MVGGDIAQVDIMHDQAEIGMERCCAHGSGLSEVGLVIRRVTTRDAVLANGKSGTRDEVVV